jgi:hypothetical protein
VTVASPWSTVRAASRFAARERVAFACPRVQAAPAELARAARSRHLTGW